MEQKKTYAVIGHPIGHTMSPFIHQRLFALSGENAEYLVFDLPDAGAQEAQETLRALDGYNITIPHKQAIIPYLSTLDEKALLFGSVNTVKNENGLAAGYTTDGAGFLRAVGAAGETLKGKNLLLGSGGAARVLAFETVLAGGSLTIAVRDQSLAKAQKLAEELVSHVPGAEVAFCSFSELEQGKKTYSLLINATSVGMYPRENASPVSENVVKRCGAVFDAVYNPDKTLLLQYAEQNGVKSIGGMAMLVGQAAAAHQIWSGAEYRPEDLAALSRDAVKEMERLFRPKKNIILCGFMGCGKSTAGRRLAALSGREFLDMDGYIEEKEGMTIPEIFRQKGEPAFRGMEAEAVKELSQKSGLVIAAGGGALLRKENAERFRSTGTVVLLEVSPAALKERLKGDTQRPLLQQPDRNAVIDRLLLERMPKYRAACDVSVDANAPAQEVAKRVLRQLGEN